MAMNERIKELIKQATTEEHDGFLYFDKKKFAELIIRECATHLHQRGVEGFGILEERNLKEHFGVKE